MFWAYPATCLVNTIYSSQLRGNGKQIFNLFIYLAYAVYKHIDKLIIVGSYIECGFINRNICVGIL
jgi:hypothetical protein